MLSSAFDYAGLYHHFVHMHHMHCSQFVRSSRCFTTFILFCFCDLCVHMFVCVCVCVHACLCMLVGVSLFQREAADDVAQIHRVSHLG